MPADTILVIDAGTSALRALAVDADGRVAPLAAEPWPVFIPEDAAPFGREFEVAGVQRAMARLIAAAAPVSASIAAIAFTGQREGIACIDDRGAAIFASPNVDARASSEGMTIDAEHEAAVYGSTGHLPSLMQAPAKLSWLRTHRPRTAEKTAYVLPLADWLATLLTGTPRVSRSLAAENGLLDVTTGEPPGDLLARLGMAVDLIPPIIACGSISGEVDRGAFAGTPVIVAGADTQCALAGMGAVAPAAAGIAAGWSTPLQLVTDRPVFDCERRTWTGVHVVSERWILESNAGELGRAFDWICTMMSLSTAEAEQLASSASIGSGDAMAVLGPRAMRASAMNAGVGGITVPLPLVMSAPDRGAVLRSVLEATAYAVRANFEQLALVYGAPLASIAVGGGMSRSSGFVQIVADVLDRPVEIATAVETSALGAGALASVAAGLHTSLDAALSAMTEGRRIVRPDPRTSAAYDDHYRRWCEMAGAFERMGG